MAAKAGGCFPGNASVMLEGGARRSMSALRPGDRVLASANGGLVFSEVMTFLDRDLDTPWLFVSLRTAAGQRLALTAAHLLFVSGRNCSEGAAPAAGQLRATYASVVRPGQCVLVAVSGAARLSRIVWVGVTTNRGAFAPLTQQGTIMVDGVAASCYAAVDSHWLAHRAFAPLRLLHCWTGRAGCYGNGLHWYSRILLWLGRTVLDPGRLHPLGVAQGDM